MQAHAITLEPAVRFIRELDSRLTAVESVPVAAGQLADLFAATFSDNLKARALLNLLHTHLLKRTIRHARESTDFYSSPAYQQFIETEPGQPPDLQAWPLIHRQDVVSNTEALIARDVTFESVTHTSGSTGQSLSIYRSSEELIFLWAYYAKLLDQARRQAASLPLILFFPNLYHGVGIRLPSFGKVFVSGVTDDTLINDALKVLTSTYRIPGHASRISVLSGLSFHIKFFTSFLLERGYDPASFDLQSLNVVGEYVLDSGRRFLQESWRAPVFERFTLTESVGGADRCLTCGHYHLDPHVIGEVLDVDTGEPLEAGVGRLVLTQLHPFVQMEPLIRYVTGDLVRRVPNSCRATMAFEFLGKESNCIGWTRNGRTEWLIFSTDLHELLSESPDYRLLDTFVNVRSVRDSTVGSPPLFTQTAGTGDDGTFRIEFVFELRYAPHWFGSRVNDLRRQLVAGLRSARTSLGRYLDDGKVTLNITFAPPNALGNAFRIKI